MAAYMLGAMIPVLVAVLMICAIDPSPARALVAGRIAAVAGLIVAGALAVGRHDELVTALTRWTTS
jgi:hypothetical protein